MAKVKAFRVGVTGANPKSIQLVTLDPPMTAKERNMVRRFRTSVGLAVSLSFEARDPGIGAMAAEIEYQNNLLVNNYIQAYRDGKAE